LTAGDFGIAYLTERWTSRFVTELFRHYTVVFVGYRVGDPVLRYMVDAFSAEQQRQGNEAYSAYAFAAYEEGQKERARQEWEAKRIKPILYNKDDGHYRLHDTLNRWAEIWEGGLTSNRNVVQSYGEKPPELLSEEKVELVTWALSDQSGAPAQTFAEMGAEAPVEWLPVLWEEGLLGDQDDPDKGPPIVSRRSLEDTRVRLSRSVEELVKWLTNHLASKTLVEWIVERGGHLHPDVQERIRRKLNEEGNAIPGAYEKVWSLLTAQDDPLCTPFDSFSIINGIEDEESWNLSLRSDFLSKLKPCLNLSPTRISADLESLWLDSSEGDNQDDSDEQSVTSVKDLIRVDCELQVGQHDQYLVDQVRGRSDWESVLEDIWFDLAKLLRKAVDLQKRADVANEYSDPSYVEHPSIRPSDQNNFFSGWTHLIDLCREAIEKIGPHPLLRELLWDWRDSLIFRRLLLHYYTQHGTPSVNTLLAEFQKNPKLWIWCNPLKAEFYLALPDIWDECHQEAKQTLGRLLAEGPPRDMYIEGLEPDEWEYRKDRITWKRLVRIRSFSDDDLIEPARSTLEEIEGHHSDWTFEETEKERLPRWSETHWGHPTDFTTEELLDLLDEELVQVLIGHDEYRDGLMDAWRNAVSQSPARAVDVLESLDDVPDVPSDIWGEALRGISETDFDAEVHFDFLHLVGGRSDPILRAAIHPATRFAEYIAPGVEGDPVREEYFSYWDRLLPLAREKEVREDENCVRTAINHPVGKLAGGLMRRLRSDLANESTGLSHDVRDRIVALLELDGGGEKVVTPIVCSRLSLLFSVAPDWTEQHVIPRLGWEDNESDSPKCAWQGYLWGASIDPSLWSKIKPHYVDTLDHLDQLSEQNVRNLTELLVIAGVEFPEGFTADEAREHLRSLGDTGRTSAARWIESRLDGAGNRASTLWKEEIGPWIREVWPPENEYRSEDESIALSLAAIKSGRAFSNAVETTLDYLIPVGRIGLVVHPLLEEGLPNQEPESSLLLLSKLIGEDTRGYGRVGSCLNQIEEAAPAITDNPEFERLKRLAIEKGWLVE
jgi:hypothetical protein